MELLSGFAWPVPRAFATAVSAGRFEQGDVFYDSPRAYGPWSAGAARAFRFRILVLDPPRSARSLPADAEGDRFTANWVSPVTCEVADHHRETREEIRSLQGRLFTCLWRGDRGLLREAAKAEDGELPPPQPLGGRELQKRLASCLPALRRASAKPGAEGTLFVSVVDESSEPSLAKARSIESALATRCAVATADLSPGEAGVEGGDAYHPALRIRGVFAEEVRPERVRELLKEALYDPARRADSAADRFKLERHGLLVPVPAAAD
jgi:hypothetical protein